MLHDYEYWNAALAGKILPVQEQNPQLGFYRMKKGDGYLPVAVFLDQEAKLVCLVNGREVTDYDFWVFCCKSPITHEAYEYFVDNGKWLDDAPELAKVGHNLPLDEFEALRLELEAEKEELSKFLAVPIKEQSQADKAAVWSKRLATLTKRANEAHKIEKQPFLDGGRLVDDKWRDLKNEPDELSKKLKRHIQPYLIEQQRIADEKARQERLERERLEIENATQFVVPQPEYVTPVASVKSGRVGATVSLRTVQKATVVDYDKAVNALKSHPDMKALVEQLAQRAAKAGVPVDGVEFHEEKVAV